MQDRARRNRRYPRPVTKPGELPIDQPGTIAGCLDRAETETAMNERTLDLALLTARPPARPLQVRRLAAMRNERQHGIAPRQHLVISGRNSLVSRHRFAQGGKPTDQLGGFSDIDLVVDRGRIAIDQQRCFRRTVGESFKLRRQAMAGQNGKSVGLLPRKVGYRGLSSFSGKNSLMTKLRPGVSRRQNRAVRYRRPATAAAAQLTSPSPAGAFSEKPAVPNPTATRAPGVPTKSLLVLIALKSLSVKPPDERDHGWIEDTVPDVGVEALAVVLRLPLKVPSQVTSDEMAQTGPRPSLSRASGPAFRNSGGRHDA